MTVVRWVIICIFLGGLPACGGDDLVDQSCDEKQRYQQVVPGKRIEAPEGLDSLNEFAEMPIPNAKDAPVRAPGSRCIDMPPSAGISE